MNFQEDGPVRTHAREGACRRGVSEAVRCDETADGGPHAGCWPAGTDYTTSAPGVAFMIFGQPRATVSPPPPIALARRAGLRSRHGHCRCRPRFRHARPCAHAQGGCLPPSSVRKIRADLATMSGTPKNGAMEDDNLSIRLRHSRESGNPERPSKILIRLFLAETLRGIPAFAGMTKYCYGFISLRSAVFLASQMS